MTTSRFNQEQLPEFNQLDIPRTQQRIQMILDKNRQQLTALLAGSDAYTFDNLMQPMENISDELSKAWSPIAHLHGVMESPELRNVYNETLPLITAYLTELSQNENLFQAVSHIAERSDFSSLDPAQHKIIENDLRDFKLAGIHLPADKKARMAELQQKLSQLMTTFSENLLDATHAWTFHITDKNQLQGLPEQALSLAADNAKQRGLEGYVFTLDYPSYSTGIMFLKDRVLRQQLYQAYSTRASDRGPYAGKWDNTPVMEAILQVRDEIAKLVGFANYATYSLATKMAKTPEEVLQFLYDLAAKSKPIAEVEYQELVDFAKKTDGLDSLEVWDVAYYSEKLRQSAFQFSQEDLRPYFPIPTVLNGMFQLVNKLFGLTIVKDDSIAVWHPQVEFFSIYDDQQQLRGGFYIDLYARPHKRDGAWMDECRQRRRLDNQTIQQPVAYLTCNFMPPVDSQPALLTHDDVLTLFHEFGHCLQHLLTTVDYASVSGINGIPWDAVEFPSQFMENFCWEKESLDMIAGHYQTGAPLPADLYQKMLNAKHFHTGLQMIRQLEFSLFDFRLHLEYNPTQSGQIQTLLNEVRKQIAVIHVPEFNRFQHSFSHIFGGSYAAGYYSYKWAEVLSADAYAAFEEKDIFDRSTGQLFMTTILESGGVYEPMASFIAFRGRKPTIDALLKQSGIT